MFDFNVRGTKSGSTYGFGRVGDGFIVFYSFCSVLGFNSEVVYSDKEK